MRGGPAGSGAGGGDNMLCAILEKLKWDCCMLVMVGGDSTGATQCWVGK